MKRISKLFIACIVSILLLVFTAVPAFAQDPGVDQASMDSYMQTVLQELTSVSEEKIDEVVAYYNENGLPDIAAGFQSWVDLKASVGEYQSVETCTFTEAEDGSIVVTAPVVCSNGTINITVTIDQDGYVSGFLFSKPGASASAEGSIGAKLKEAAVNLVVGMGTVFAVLIFLCWVISLFKNISKIEKKLADRKASKNAAAPAAKEVEPAKTVSVNTVPANADELEAVIAAAIAAYEADNGSTIEKQPALGNGITIKTYRRN